VSRRRRSALGAITLAVVLGGLAWTFHAQGLDGLNKLSSIAGGITGIIGVYLAWGERRPAVASNRAEFDALALDALADAVERVWKPEERHRRLLNPHPLPTAWVTVGPPIADHWANIRADGIDEPLDLDGAVDLEHPDALHQTVADSRLRGRVVILGEPGAGKTALLLRLTLNLLRTREPGHPVPVLLRLPTWNPMEITLAQWTADRLEADYGHRRPVPAEHLLLILDGLDEMPPERRRRAVQAISNAFSPRAPLVLSSRTTEYLDTRRTLTGSVLPAAAVVELTPLAPDTVGDYLARAGRGDWNSVFAYDADKHGGRLAAALAAPLWIDLARTAYTDPNQPRRNPVELLYLPIYAIHPHLLDRLIPTAYPDPPEPGPDGHTWHRAAAHRWLRHLAIDMRIRGTQDLAWWELALSVPRTAYAAFGLVFGLTSGLAVGLPFGPALGLALGFVFGLAFGLVFGIVAPPVPSRGRIRLRRTRRALPRRLASVFVFALLFGLATGSASGPLIAVIVAIAGGPTGQLVFAITSVFVYGFLFGFLFALADEFTTLLREGDADISAATDPLGLVRDDRRRTLVGGFAVGLAFGLASGFVFGRAFGLVFGLASGLAVGLGAWAWLQVTRLWWCGRGRLPWPLMAFLADAHRRGVLRQAGGVYQFRHALLRDRLAATAEEDPPG
jgi:hypothetical protein